MLILFHPIRLAQFNNSGVFCSQYVELTRNVIFVNVSLICKLNYLLIKAMGSVRSPWIPTVRFLSLVLFKSMQKASG